MRDQEIQCSRCGLMYPPHWITRDCCIPCYGEFMNNNRRINEELKYIYS